MNDFTFSKLMLNDAYLISDFYSGDGRGGFTKSFEKDIFRNAGIPFSVNEIFWSLSAKNVIRGLHFQRQRPQAKLVCVVKGKVWDVIVDLRIGSSTYGQWTGIELSEENHQALYVPKGFAHGFASLENDTIMLYQCSGAYDKESDTGILVNDSDLGITWPIEEKDAIRSQRDMTLMTMKEYEKNPIALNDVCGA